ncbi:hypothetical protein ACIGZJ_25955 [Kitasatospora sp. NPDC052868]|uniref:hypothetical protein n=1 Tax=Kitasatospora sp. NPDC052868 TaxID=3364060 RepID=UPI0037C89C17
MNLAELLRTDVDALAREFRDHDPVAFTRRLAERIGGGSGAPGPPPAGPSVPAQRTAAGRAERPPSAARRQPPPAAPDGHPRTRTEPAALAALTAAGRAELRRDLRYLCGGIAAAADVSELALDLELAEKAAFRTLGCVLYGMGRAADGVFWWRIAAQLGDQLAVHCLAVHYAAEGDQRDAAHWGALAEDLSAPDRLPAVALGTCPGRPADMVRTLALECDGEIVLTLREAVAGTRPVAVQTAPRPGRGRAPATRRRPARSR